MKFKINATQHASPFHTIPSHSTQNATFPRSQNAQNQVQISNDGMCRNDWVWERTSVTWAERWHTFGRKNRRDRLGRGDATKAPRQVQTANRNDSPTTRHKSPSKPAQPPNDGPVTCGDIYQRTQRTSKPSVSKPRNVSKHE